MATKKNAEKVEAEINAEVANVRVELKEVNHGLHTVYMANAVVAFENGVAEVEKEIAKALKKLGMIK